MYTCHYTRQDILFNAFNVFSFVQSYPHTHDFIYDMIPINSPVI